MKLSSTHCYYVLHDLQVNILSIVIEVECFENELLVPMFTNKCDVQYLVVAVGLHPFTPT